MWLIPCLLQTEAWAEDSLWELRGSYSPHSNPWQTNPGKRRAQKPSRRKVICLNSWPTNTLNPDETPERKIIMYLQQRKKWWLKNKTRYVNNFRILFLVIIFHSLCESKNWIWIYLIYYSIALPFSCFIFFFFSFKAGFISRIGKLIFSWSGAMTEFAFLHG